MTVEATREKLARINHGRWRRNIIQKKLMIRMIKEASGVVITENIDSFEVHSCG